MPSHSIADRIRACCQVLAMRRCRETGREIGVWKNPGTTHELFAPEFVSPVSY